MLPTASGRTALVIPEEYHSALVSLLHKSKIKGISVQKVWAMRSSPSMILNKDAQIVHQFVSFFRIKELSLDIKGF